MVPAAAATGQRVSWGPTAAPPRAAGADAARPNRRRNAGVATAARRGQARAAAARSRGRPLAVRPARASTRARLAVLPSFVRTSEVFLPPLIREVFQAGTSYASLLVFPTNQIAPGGGVGGDY